MHFSAEKLKLTFLELKLCPSCRLFFEPDVSQPLPVAVDVVEVPPAVENIANDNNPQQQQPLEPVQRPCLGSRLLQGIQIQTISAFHLVCMKFESSNLLD